MNLRKKIRGFFTLTRKANGGFTLVELVVVIAILAILAGAAVPAYSGYINKANEAADQQLLAALNTAYASACAAEGESHVNRTDVTGIALKEGKIPGGYVMTRNDSIDSNFDLFFPADSQFKQLVLLSFDQAQGIFTGDTVAAIVEDLKAIAANGNGVSDPEVIEGIMGSFDKIDNLLKAGVNLAEFMGQVPEDVADALGFTEMLAGFDEMGVEHFVNDAAGRTAEEIMDGAMSLMAMLTPAYDGTYNSVTEGQVVEAYWNTLTEEQKTAFGSLGEDGSFTEAQLLEAQANLGLTFGDLDLNAKQVVAVMNGIGDQKNNADISGLSGMYALAAGFFNSEYYTGTEQDKPTDFSQFSAVQSAMLLNNEAFMSYINDDKGDNRAMKDMEAYVGYMKYLSTGEFDSYETEGFDYIKEALGWE